MKKWGNIWDNGIVEESNKKRDSLISTGIQYRF